MAAVIVIPQLIALDLDGTCLCYEPDLHVDPVVVACLRDVRRRHGTRWVMNSDRWETTMRQIAARLPAPDQPDAILSCQHLLFWRGDDGTYAPHEPWNTEQRELHQRLWHEIMPRFPSWRQAIEDRFTVREAYTDDTAFAFLLGAGETPSARDLIAELAAPWPDACISGNHEWLFIVHAAFSKARVLRECAVHIGIAPEQTLAIGDGYNDVAMLNGDLTPLVGCPANAGPEVLDAVRAAAGFVAPHDDGKGAAAVIRHYFGAAGGKTGKRRREQISRPRAGSF